LFSYNVGERKYLNLSKAELKLKLSGAILLDDIVMMLPFIGIAPEPIGPVRVLYLEARGFVVPDWNVTGMLCNGPKKVP
jgi:hypothetical protein